MISRRPWRENVLATGLEQRLKAAGCPLSFTEVCDVQDIRSLPLTSWAQKSLGEGVMLRTAQSERLARGQSLAEIARGTGITVDQVLYYLTRFEWEFADDVSEFYNR